MSSITDKLIELGIEPLDGGAFTPFSEQEVASIQAITGAAIPETYKQFLIRFGGSMFSSEVNCTRSGDPLYFGWFFRFSELLDAIENLKDFLPETIIPIGDDGGANLFCLGVDGSDVGKVYFHNHNIGWHADAERYLAQGDPVPPNIRYQTICEVAPSFEQFILNMVKEA